MSKLIPTMLLLAALSMSACGATQIDRARTILSVSGQSVVAVERVFAPEYTAAGERARVEATNVAEYLEAMRRWSAAATSIDLTSRALRLAETQLDAIEQGTGGDVLGVLACVATSLEQLLDALAAVVDVPDPLVATVQAVSAFAGDICDPDAVVPGSPQ